MGGSVKVYVGVCWLCLAQRGYYPSQGLLLCACVPCFSDSRVPCENHSAVVVHVPGARSCVLAVVYFQG
jgi:hypothetical protein